MRPHRLHLRVAGLVAILVTLTACGGEQPTGPQAGAPEPTAALSRDEVESCLAEAGVNLATGKTPLIASAQGIGVDPGAGPLLPGKLNAAAYVYASEEEAAGAETSLQPSGGGIAQYAPLFDEVVVSGNTLVVYAAPVAPETRTAIEACTSAG